MDGEVDERVVEEVGGRGWCVRGSEAAAQETGQVSTWVRT